MKLISNEYEKATSSRCRWVKDPVRTSLQRSEAEDNLTPLRLQLLIASFFGTIMLVQSDVNLMFLVHQRHHRGLSSPILTEPQGETHSRFPKPSCRSRRCTENHRGYILQYSALLVLRCLSSHSRCLALGLAVTCLRVGNRRLRL